MDKVYIANYFGKNSNILTSTAFSNYESAKNFLLSIYEEELPILLKADDILEAEHGFRMNWPPIDIAREKFDKFHNIKSYAYIEILEVHD